MSKNKTSQRVLASVNVPQLLIRGPALIGFSVTGLLVAIVAAFVIFVPIDNYIQITARAVLDQKLWTLSVPHLDHTSRQTNEIDVILAKYSKINQAGIRAILIDVHGQKTMPLAVQLYVNPGNTPKKQSLFNTRFLTKTRTRQIIFKITASGLQFAKQVDLQSKLNAIILIHTGSQTILERLREGFAITS